MDPVPNSWVLEHARGFIAIANPGHGEWGRERLVHTYCLAECAKMLALLQTSCASWVLMPSTCRDYSTCETDF